MAQKQIRRQRLSAAESQRQILEATLKLIPKHGWGNTSFQMIADACKTSQSNVLYHFKTREALLDSLLNKISNNNFRLVDEAIKPEFDAFQRIMAHFERNLEWVLRFPEEAQIIVLVYYEATHDPHFARVFKQILERAQNRILVYILAGMREKIFEPKLAPEILSKVLHSTLVGALINLASGRLTQVKNYKKTEWQTIISDLTGYRNNPHR